MSNELHSAKVDFEGLMEVLGKNLYSTPMVGIRELVQNAHDSCTRRQLEHDGWEMSSGSIRILVNGTKLEIQDTGAGLTHDEVIDYLATVGRGYTRVLRSSTGDPSLIGTFGLGFLSAFVLSDLVEVITTSYQSPDETWRFTSKSGQQFGLEPLQNPRPIGTRVVLTLSEPFHDLADLDRLERVLGHYCALLSVPIFVGDGKHPMNALVPPWQLPDDARQSVAGLKARLDFAQLFERHYQPLAAVEIPPTKDGTVIGGLLWIQDGANYATSDNRNMSVFVRGMLVSPDERDLLPAWAGFIGGVVVSDALVPTASREDLMKDEVYAAAQEHIRSALVQGLEHIARHESAAWRRVLRRHNEALLGSAIADERLYGLLADELTVPTTEGDLRINEILKASKRLYISVIERQGPEEVLFRALQTPIVDGGRYAVFPFLKRVADERGIPVVEFGSKQGHDQLFPTADLDKAQLEVLQTLFGRENFSVQPTTFDPPTLPCVLVYDQAVKLKKRLEDDAADERIAKASLGLARLFTKKIDDSVSATLYINTRSPVVADLLGSDAGAKPTMVAQMMWSIATLMSPSSDSARGLETALQDLNNAMAAILANDTVNS